jgi:hypothetical protein
MLNVFKLSGVLAERRGAILKHFFFISEQRDAGRAMKLLLESESEKACQGPML